MEESELKFKRDKKYIEILNSLNKQHRQGEYGIFDCGDLGFIFISWHHSWKGEWFFPSKEFKEGEHG